MCWHMWQLINNLQHYAEDPLCRPPELSMGTNKPFLQILVDHQKQRHRQKPSIIRAAPLPSRACQTSDERWWNRPEPNLNGHVDPNGTLYIEVSDWITTDTRQGPSTEPGVPNPESRNFGTPHLPRLYRSPPTSPQGKQTFSDHQRGKSTSQRQGRGQQQKYQQQYQQQQQASPVQHVEAEPSAREGEASSSSAAAKNTVESRGMGFRPKTRKITSTKGLEPPSCPICINPLLQAREVVATACG